MAGKGGIGTLNPPDDGQEIAPVIPLRQGHAAAPVPPSARRVLPPEGSLWDPGIEPEGSPPNRRLRRALPRPLFLPTVRLPLANRRFFWKLGAILGGAIALLSGVGLVLAVSGGHPRVTTGASTATETTSSTSGQGRTTSRSVALATELHSRHSYPSHKRTRRSKHARTRAHHRAQHRHASSTGSHSGMRSSPTYDSSTASPTYSSTTNYAPVSSSSSQAATSQATTASGSVGAQSKRPAFGLNGTLGPGSSPDG